MKVFHILTICDVLSQSQDKVFKSHDFWGNLFCRNIMLSFEVIMTLNFNFVPSDAILIKRSRYEEYICLAATFMILNILAK